MRELETTMAARLPENTDGPRAAYRRRNMSIRDDFRKVASDLRHDLKDGEEHLGWLLGEVERQIGIAEERAVALAHKIEAEIEDEEESDPPAELDISKLTVVELKSLAAERGVDIDGITKKADIIAELENPSAEAEIEDEEESEEDEESSNDES